VILNRGLYWEFNQSLSRTRIERLKQDHRVFQYVEHLIIKLKFRSAFKFIGTKLTSAYIAYLTGKNVNKWTCDSSGNTTCKNRKYLMLISCNG
jgi:hypothetical protein